MSRLGLVCCLAVVLGAGLLPDTAFAEEKLADLERFCRETFGPQASPGTDRRDSGLLCSIPMSPGPGVLHQKMPAQLVCFTQHQANRFRWEGGRLYCITGGASAAPRSVDLTKHCKDAHGPDAFVTTRRTDNKPMCTIRTSGGLGLRHHVIDTASLCGGGRGQVTGNTLNCTGGPTAGGGGGGGGGAGGAPRASDSAPRPGRAKLRDWEFPPLDPEDIIDTAGTGQLFDEDVKLANLKDCGGTSPLLWSPDEANARFRDSGGLDGLGWTHQGASRLCPGLTGGKVVDFQTFCKENLNPTRSKASVRVTPSGRPICWYRGRSEPENIPRLLMMDTTSSSEQICMSAFLDPLPSEERRAVWQDYVYLFKYTAKELKMECFFMKQCQLRELLDLGDPCEDPELKFTQRREKDGPIEEIEGDLKYFGGPVFVELQFPKEQEEDSFFVTVEWEDGETHGKKRTEVLVSRTEEDKTLYRSEGIDIEPYTPLADRSTPPLSAAMPQPVVQP